MNINGTINVWIHAHTHDDPGWLVKADQYYVKVSTAKSFSAVASALHPGYRDRRSGSEPREKVHVDSCAIWMTSSYVEQGFFQRWWREQDEHMKALVHKLVDNGQVDAQSGREV